MSGKSEPGYSHVLKEIAESSSVHGIPKIVSSRQIPVKVLWFLLALVTFGVMSYQLYSLLVEFNSNPVVTRVGLKFSNLRYPDITFCNMNPLRKSKLKTLFAVVNEANKKKQSKSKQKMQDTPPTKPDSKRGKPEEGDNDMTKVERPEPPSYMAAPDDSTHNRDLMMNDAPINDNNGSPTIDTTVTPTSTQKQLDETTKHAEEEFDGVSDYIFDYTLVAPPYEDGDTTDSPPFMLEPWDYYTDYYDAEIDAENDTLEIMFGVPAYDDGFDDDVRDDFDDDVTDDYEEETAELLKTQKEGLKKMRDTIKTKIKQAPVELIRDLGHQKEDMVISFSFAGRRQDISEIEQISSPHYGNCYKISSKKFKAWRSGQDHGMKLTLNLETSEYMSGFASGYGIRVAFNEPGSLAMPNEEGITVSSGFDTSIGLRTVQISRLAEPYGKCSDGEEFFKRYGRKYTLAACMEFCRVDHVIETCRCIPFDAPGIYNKANYEGIDICKPLPHKDEKCVLDVEFKLDDGESTRCDCPSVCNEIVYDKALSGRFWPTDDYLSKALMREVCKRNIASMKEACDQRKNGTFDPALYKKDFLTIRIYYEDLNYESISEEPMYEPVRFVSDVGGAMGLFMGVSVLSLVEILQLLLETVLYFSRRTKPQHGANGGQTNVAAQPMI